MLLAGVGFSFITPATTKGVMDNVEAQLRATAMGMKQTGVPLGGVLAAALLPSIAIVTGWRMTFFIAGISSVLAGLLLWRVYRGRLTSGIQPIRQPATSPMTGLKQFIADRNLVLTTIIQAVFSAAQRSVGAYFALFLNQWVGLSVVASGFGLATVLAAGVLGRIMWGLFSDYCMHGRRKGTLSMIGSMSLFMLLGVALMKPSTSRIVVFVAAFLLGIGVYGWAGQLLVLRSELVAPDRVGVVTSLGFVLSAWGSIAGPPLFGFVADVSGDYRLSWILLAGLLASSLLLLQTMSEIHNPLQVSDSIS